MMSSPFRKLIVISYLLIVGIDFMYQVTLQIYSINNIHSSIINKKPQPSQNGKLGYDNQYTIINIKSYIPIPSPRKLDGTTPVGLLAYDSGGIAFPYRSRSRYLPGTQAKQWLRDAVY